MGQAFHDHLSNKRGLSARCDHFRVRARADRGRRGFFIGGTLLDLLSARIEGRVAHREIECIGAK